MAVAESMERHNSMATQILGQEKIRELFGNIVLDMVYEKMKNNNTTSFVEE